MHRLDLRRGLQFDLDPSGRALVECLERVDRTVREPDADMLYDVAVVDAGPAALAAAIYAASEGQSVIVLVRWPSGARPVTPTGWRIIHAFRPAAPAMRSPHALPALLKRVLREVG